jgi:hypothetical protein
LPVSCYSRCSIRFRGCDAVWLARHRPIPDSALRRSLISSIIAGVSTEARSVRMNAWLA